MLASPMHSLGISSASIAAIIIAISFAAGLNLYATVASLGLMARLHWVPLPPGLESLAHPWVIAAASALFALEFVADKIPGFDLLWNALHTFIRIPAAALLAFAAGQHLSPELHVLVTAVGAMVAAIAHTGKTAARVAVTPSPEPVSNIALSTTEDAAAVGLSWAALHHPIATGIGVAALTLATALLIWKAWRTLRATITRFRSKWRGGSPHATLTNSTSHRLQNLP